MVLKRRCDEQDGDESGVSVQESKRQSRVVKDVLRGFSLDDIVLHMTPFLERVVREEVERCILLFLHPSPRSRLNQTDSSEIRRWQLQFVKKFPSHLFSGSKIESEDHGPVEIIIVDANSNTKITSGPLSSLKIQIHVVDGNFGKGGQEDWTEEEFNCHIVHARDGKRPLLAGDLIVTLQNGVGYIGDISFTDNSSWTRSGKFRLGAKVVTGICDGVRVREAKSEAFGVKDHRGESYKKHYPPSLGDDVWRLDRIAKDGIFHTRLASEGILSVKDFLQLYITNPSLLRMILGNGISNRKWDTIIDHANTCVLDDNKFYVYYNAEHMFSLLFNSIYKVVGVTFDGQSYMSLDILTASQKAFLEKMKQHAYKNVADFISVDNSSIIGSLRPLLHPQVDPLIDPIFALQHLDFPCTHQDQQEFNHSSSTSYTHEDDECQLEFSEQYFLPY